jgi:hypothetical protein
MALVRSRLVDQVVIYRLDRLTRSLRDSVDIFEEFRNAEMPESFTASTPGLSGNLTKVDHEIQLIPCR